MPASEQTWYNIKRLHKVFAVSSLALLAVTIWLIAVDHHREWKAIQRTGDRIESQMAAWRGVQYRTEAVAGERQRLEQQLAAIRAAPLAADPLRRFQAELRREAERLGNAPPALTELEQQIARMNRAGEAADTARHRREVLARLGQFIELARFREDRALDRRKDWQAKLDVAKGRYGIAVRGREPEPVLARLRDRCRRLEQEHSAAHRAYEAATAHHERLQQLVNELTEDAAALQKQLDELLAEMRRLQRVVAEKQSRLFHFDHGIPLPGKKWLELPILDAFNSPRAIETVWSEGLELELGSFGTVRRFDRCTTCHGAMEQTLPGAPEQPAYVHQRLIEFRLRPPAEPPEDLADVDQLEPPVVASQVRQVYGLRLASRGLLETADATVQWVRPGSPAAAAQRPPRVDGELLGGEVLRRVFRTSGLQLGTAGRLPGLLVGDALVAINGESPPAGSRAADWVGRRLLQLAAANWEASDADEPTPIRLAIRRGVPHPFASHPRPDLYVAAGSAHPKAEFGCTVCHGGQGSATAFRWAAHTPNTPAARKTWHRQYDWFADQHWPFPMLPRRFAESGCVRCHHQMTELAAHAERRQAPAPKLTEGHRLVRQLGCFGCHEIQGFEGPTRSIGPDLRLEPPYHAVALQLKGAPDTGYENLTDVEQGWIEQLIAEPERDDVRHRLIEMISADGRRAGAHGAVAASGEAVAAGSAASPPPPRLSADVHRRLLPLLADREVPGALRKPGPSLRFVAEKLSFDFLADWIGNPRRFRPATQMPSYFGLWRHLPGPALRRQRVALEAERNRLASLADRSAQRRRQAIERELTAIDDELSDVDPQARRFEPIEVFSMARYLLQRSQAAPVIAPPTHGVLDQGAEPQREQIERGRIAFEQQGCLACHAHRDFPDMEAYRQTGAVNRAPDLSDLADKLGTPRDPTGAHWLYGWIKRPTGYHARTVMPDMRLDPIEQRDESGQLTRTVDPAADIVAYLLASTSSGWQPSADVVVELDPSQRAALNELALEHLRGVFREATARQFLQRGIPASQHAELQGPERELLVTDPAHGAATTQLPQQKLLAFVAKKSFIKHGCCACHDIPGMEDARPIGIGLNDWGRKDPGQLAFHSVVAYLESGRDAARAAAEPPAAGAPEWASSPQRPPPFYFEQLRLHSRIGFAHRKLTEPRSYDYRMTELKGYNERLRMPQFTLSAPEKEQILTFVLGLVADPPPQKYLYAADRHEQALLRGEQVLDKYNCRACHMTDVERWQIAYPPGDYGPRPEPQTFPFVLARFGHEAIAAAQAVDRRHLRQATLHGLIAIGDDGLPRVLDEEEFPLEADDEYAYDVSSLIFPFDLYRPALVDGEPYQVGGAPLFVPGWQVERRDEARGGDLTRFLLPRVVRREKEVNPAAKGSEAWSWLPPPLMGQGAKVQADWLHGYLLDPTPIRPAVLMEMPRYNLSAAEAEALVGYFAARDGADYPRASSARQRSTYLQQADDRYAERLRQSREEADAADPAPAPADQLAGGRHLADAMRIVTSENYCVTCHIVGDFDPVSSDRAKAPDLTRVRQRLRPDYLRTWLARPASVLPYTGMQINFNYDAEDPLLGATIPQELYRGDSVQQLDAVVDLLIHFDWYLQQRAPVAPLVAPPAPDD